MLTNNYRYRLPSEVRTRTFWNHDFGAWQACSFPQVCVHRHLAAARTVRRVPGHTRATNCRACSEVMSAGKARTRASGKEGKCGKIRGTIFFFGNLKIVDNSETSWIFKSSLRGTHRETQDLRMMMMTVYFKNRKTRLSSLLRAGLNSGPKKAAQLKGTRSCIGSLQKSRGAGGKGQGHGRAVKPRSSLSCLAKPSSQTRLHPGLL